MAHHTGVTALPSAHDAVAITPSDTTVIPVTRFIYVSGTGAIKVRMADGNDCTFAVVPVGEFRVQVDKVYSTGTTATNLVAMY